MFGMAVPASRTRIDRLHPAVFGLKIGHFCGYIRVACHAPIVHGGKFPGGRVTQLALTRNFSMRGNPAEGLSLNRIKRARAEHQASGRETIARDGQRCYQRSHDSGPGETTQAV